MRQTPTPPLPGAHTAPLSALGKSREQVCRGIGKKARERAAEVVSPVKGQAQ